MSFPAKLVLDQVEHEFRKCYGMPSHVKDDGQIGQLDSSAGVAGGSVGDIQDPPQPPPQAIEFHGRNVFSVGENEFLVSDNEGNVLEAFLEHSVMDTATLESTSGVNYPARVLRKLATKYEDAFKPFIRFPGGKGKGGYGVKICRAQIAPK